MAGRSNLTVALVDWDSWEDWQVHFWAVVAAAMVVLAVDIRTVVLLEWLVLWLVVFLEEGRSRIILSKEVLDHRDNMGRVD